MSKSLDLRALKAFVATAREGSVSRAASSLNLTQPAVSLQLRQIAEQTGLKLFTRTSKGVLLTRDGAQLLSHAEKVLQAQAELMQAAYRMSASVRGTLRVGTILDPEFTRLGAFLRAVFGIAPEIRPELHQGMSGEVMSSVLAGNLDVGYAVVPDCSETDDAGGPGTPDARLNVQPLIRFNYRVIAPAGWGPQVHPLDWPELVQLPWVQTPAESSHSRLLASILEPRGLRLNAVAQVDQESSMLSLVRSGMGLSLARDAVAIRESQLNGLTVAERTSLPALLSFVSLRKQRSRELVRVALEAIRSCWLTAEELPIRV
ncbi:MAG: LysR family transcriptional regulator [Rubrivivax sp.]|jgi:DNA-binding transcriptional LysR family regulator